MLGEVLPTVDRPHRVPCRGPALPCLLEETWSRARPLQQETRDARKSGLNHQQLSQGKGGGQLPGKGQALVLLREPWVQMKCLVVGPAGRQPAQAVNLPFIICSKAFTVNKRAN